MRSHARRFLLDLRRVRGGVVAVGMAAFVVVVALTFQVPFALQALNPDVLSGQPPREPLSFVRVIDPNDSIDVLLDESFVPVLETPGIATLLARLERHPDAFLVLPLSMLTEDRDQGFLGRPVMFPAPADRGLVVVGAKPPFLDLAAPAAEPVLLWGSIAGQVPGIDDTRLGPYPVRQVSAAPPDAPFVAGTGGSGGTGDQPVLAMTVGTAQSLGTDAMTTPADIASALTCYCPESEMQAVAAAMTDAERAAGTGRVYYAVGWDGLIGPLERSYSVSDIVEVLVPAGTLLAVLALVVTAGRLFWARRSPAHRVEILYGAGEASVQVRQQLLVALSLTLPAVVGFLALDAVLQSTYTPPPWPPGGGLTFIVVAAGLQLVAGTGPAIRVHRLASNPVKEERYV